MKKIIFATSLLFLAAICQAQNIALSGAIKNAPANAKLYLFEYFGAGYHIADSTIVKGGQFKFSTKQPLPRGFYQVGGDANNSFIIILAQEKPTVTADWKNLKETVLIENSVENTLFRKMMVFNTSIAAIETEARDITSLKEQNPVEYNKRFEGLKKRYDSLNASHSNMKMSAINGQPQLFFSKVLKMFQLPESVEKDQFFSEAEYSDAEYTRGDMLNNKLAFYFQKYAGQDGELWKAEAENIVKSFKEKTKNRELAYIISIQLLLQNGLDIPRSLTNGLKSEFKSSQRAMDLIASLPKSEPREGESAPDITLADINGKKLLLSSLKGKYVLLDFWASWCGPCRMENPNVVKVYNSYKDKGFTIYSVSLDQSKENWLNAIQKDGLSWPNHVSDLKGWQSEGAALYAVKGIPATFLIDKNGVIIAKNLRGFALEKKLSELIP